MQDNDQKPVYEIHDYSAVERYMRAQNERRELENQAIINSSSAHRLKYIALCIAIPAGQFNLL